MHISASMKLLCASVACASVYYHCCDATQRIGALLPQAAPPSGVAAAAPGPLASPFGTATWFWLTDKGMAAST